MRMLLAIFAFGVLAGCTTPVVTGASRDSITIQYDPMLYKREEIAALAASHCGAEAVFISSSRALPHSMQHDVFYCRHQAIHAR